MQVNYRNPTDATERKHHEHVGRSHSAVGSRTIGVQRQGGADAQHDQPGRAGSGLGPGVHQGESSAAFQAAHARFVEVAARVNTLLDIAQANLGDAAGTYVAADAAAASGYTAF